MQGHGIEAHPFISRLAQAKLYWREDPVVFKEHAFDILERSRSISVDLSNTSSLIQKCFARETFKSLAALIEAWRENADDSPYSELTWLALISIIRSCSTAGTAQWQYILPKKEKKNVADPVEAFTAKVRSMARDMNTRRHWALGPQGIINRDDARECLTVQDGWADLVITSPPYVNNYDYADATRLELTVLGEIDRWKDLHDKVRKYLLPSCTQHVTKHRDQTFQILSDDLLDPIRTEIETTCQELEAISKQRKGKKAYHTLVAAYFRSMAQVWKALRRVTEQGGLVCFVVGDSAPYGVYVPVDRWLGELAVASGFKSYSFEKTRDRNVKWKNRKHRVPLKEGYLWIQG